MSNTGNAAVSDPQLIADLTAAFTAAAKAVVGIDSAAAKPDPGRARTTRDYDVIRGLLGQVGSPQPLPMRRTSKNTIVMDVDPPTSATVAIVQTQAGVVESVAVPTSKPVELSLTSDPKVPLSHVELLDATGKFVAFGPSLPAA